MIIWETFKIYVVGTIAVSALSKIVTILAGA